ncbi:DUF4168 domain-containing protein [Thioalkalivibrio sp. XN279]|uniref:DUF4168 domain-containing protein n=1 Tax=Thioalkalivibrio sp. XN279 TaxID=2714953 RepID=UPI0014087663|nr:DUF4168 domain-containing protein [Thioalkalivibrio sp. XN279]NHA15430.1 DUF4168 domain-containing protein [Thioalkalivibrio sp. XN279]
MRHRRHTAFAIAAAASLAAGLAAAPAVAEEGYGTGQEQAAPRAEVSSAKLDQFVVALERVHSIGNQASAEMEQSRDMEEAQQIQQNAQGQMIEAVEEAGLTVDEYNRIAQLMNSDPEVQERINSRLEERS